MNVIQNQGIADCIVISKFPALRLGRKKDRFPQYPGGILDFAMQFIANQVNVQISCASFKILTSVMALINWIKFNIIYLIIKFQAN